MKTKNVCMLILTAFIWGTAFVAQSVGMDYLGPFTFNESGAWSAAWPCCRASIFLGNGKEWPKMARKRRMRRGPGAGIFWQEGLPADPAVWSQQPAAGGNSIHNCRKSRIYHRLLHRDRAGFGNILEKEDRWKVWAAVVLAVVGLYFLCITESLRIGKGDLLVFLCALVFSLHILVIDYFAPRADGVKMSCIQFFVCGILSLPVMFLTETPAIKGMIAGWFPLFLCRSIILRQWRTRCRLLGKRIWTRLLPPWF